MTEKDSFEQGADSVEPLLVPHFICSEACVHAGNADYMEKSPGRQLSLKIGLISDQLVGEMTGR